MNGIKYDYDKPRMDLLDYQFLLNTAQVMSYGAEKYAAYNWKGLHASRLFAALQRHLSSFWSGQDLDEESGLNHLYHASASLMMLASVIRDNPEELDDRYFQEKISYQREINLEECLETIEKNKKHYKRLMKAKKKRIRND